MKNIPYGHQYIDASDAIEVLKVVKSDWLTQGPKIKGFEDALCKYTGAKYAVAVSSGTAALHIACLAAGIKKGDEVITSPMTFAASANCVLYCGGKPVFADIEADTANIDPAEIKKKITRKTKAVIPVHYAGHPADLKEIRDIAKKHNLIVIEDAAHALGAEYKGAKIGACRYSDMAIFSFHPVKSITTGEGGAVMTNRKDLYDVLMTLRNHGIVKGKEWHYEMRLLGFNYRITDMQCALGISQLKKLDSFIGKRRKIILAYNTFFENNPYFDTPRETEYVRSSWHLYPIRLKGRHMLRKQEIFNALRKCGVGVQVHYIPVYTHPYYKTFGYRNRICRKAEKFYAAEISLPLYPSMTENDIKFVATTIIKTLHKTGGKNDASIL